MPASKYESHVAPKLVLVEAWARDGMIDEDIAKKLGVGYSTFRVYKEQHPALLASLQRGKEVADIEVENALFKRALGYRYDEVTRERVNAIDDNGELIMEMAETKRVTKEVNPDVAAQIFWLKNRRPTTWRDKQAVEHTGEDGTPLQVMFNIPRPPKAENGKNNE